MHLYQIKSHIDHGVLFSGYYQSIIECLEDAVTQKKDLSGAQLSHLNLSNANLDDAHMPGAHFIGTNLIGTNLSEAYLPDCRFHHALLYNTCLCHSDLSHSNFQDANFGATDIAGSILCHCLFSNLSWTELDFRSALNINGCTFVTHDGSNHDISLGPVIIKGLLNTPIIITDHHAVIGKTYIPKDIIWPVLGKIEQKILKNYRK